MKTCKICQKKFQPNRPEQVFCGMSCRQANNGTGRKGQKTGPQAGRAYKKSANRDGYLMMYAAHHPFADGRKMIAEHVMLMEVAVGRRLLPGECVHHKNGNKTDNRIENLEIQAHAEHSRRHNKEIARRRKRIGGRFA